MARRHQALRAGSSLGTIPSRFAPHLPHDDRRSMVRSLLHGLSLSLLVTLAVGPSFSFASDGDGLSSLIDGAVRTGSGKIETAQVATESADELGTEAPAAKPPARDYLVFFDFDKTDIRPEAASILDRAAQGVFAIGSSNVTLVGHADTSGPARYNQWLSERRAFAVRQYLLGKGIAADVITKGRGEEDPRVDTNDGVEEQENRRVEIQIN